jgi:hypothetical protein
MRRLLALVSIVAALVVGRTVAAQQPTRMQAQPGAPGEGRALERQFRERFADVVQRRLRLSNVQMRQLGQVNNRFERERMQLMRDERMMRQALRAEVLAGDSANQPRVAELLDEAMRIQRARLDITEREQRELAAFMTPLQRAQYVTIQDELRRRLEDIRQQRRPGAPGMAGRRPPL